MYCANYDDQSIGYIYIEGGDINIKAGDDAIRGNSAVIINWGVISIDECQEGLEASQIIINDGVVTVYSNHDGLNAALKIHIELWFK